MRSNKGKVAAILLADIHLSLNPPVWRSAEPNWFEAMKRPILEVKALQEKYNCPIIAAGDIFNTWYSPPEVINFALEYLPYMYAIPGQHDLPMHDYEDIKKSAYWTLVKADKILDMSTTNMLIGKYGMIQGFPFGYKITPCAKLEGNLDIAVAHDYKWIPGSSYSHADKNDDISNKQPLRKGGKYKGYDIIVYGDNHQGFKTQIGKTQIFNCGSLMRRKSDQLNYKPQVGLLLESGKVVTHYLDISKDKHLILDTTTDIGEAPDMRTLIQELEKLDGIDMDFSKVMMQYLKQNRIKKTICNIILKAMEQL